jgi:hypothetical protein
LHLFDDDRGTHGFVIDAAKIIAGEFKFAGFFRNETQPDGLAGFDIGAQPRRGTLKPWITS